jgi:hypothetical protein
MSKLVVQSTSQGLIVPADVLEQAGVAPGSHVEIIPLPRSEEIHHRAVRHTVWTLGDMIRIGRPEMIAGEWMVELWSPDDARCIGRLYFDVRGELIADKSSTRNTLA